MYDRNCDWKSYQRELKPEDVAAMFGKKMKTHALTAVQYNDLLHSLKAGERLRCMKSAEDGFTAIIVNGERFVLASQPDAVEYAQGQRADWWGKED
jgi:hypothetical protein